MTSASIKTMFTKSMLKVGRRLQRLAPAILGVSGALVVITGCESSSVSSVTARSPQPAAITVAQPPESMVANPARSPEVPGKQLEGVTIREGDVVKISFPGAPKLDTTQQVRADGVVTLDVLGEIKVIGQSPTELEKTLSQLFASQLVSNEVSVIIVSSSFEVYVTGAVLRPGKITSTRPITAFQAIMEAGYDPVNSNLEKVTLIRQVDRSKYTYIPLNLQLVLEGKDAEPFYLKPSDTLQVPKKISIF